MKTKGCDLIATSVWYGATAWPPPPRSTVLKRRSVIAETLRTEEIILGTLQNWAIPYTLRQSTNFPGDHTSHWLSKVRLTSITRTEIRPFTVIGAFGKKFREDSLDTGYLLGLDTHFADYLTFLLTPVRYLL
jgi:hypothetical protein